MTVMAAPAIRPGAKGTGVRTPARTAPGRAQTQPMNRPAATAYTASSTKTP